MSRLMLSASEAELLSLLVRKHVRFMVVGGHAVVFHGYLRPLDDLDLWVEASAANARKIAATLFSQGIQIGADQIERLEQPRAQLRLMGHGSKVEFLTSIDGCQDFAEAYGRSGFDWQTGQTIRVICYDDLIASKRAAWAGDKTRIKDLADLNALEALRK